VDTVSTTSITDDAALWKEIGGWRREKEGGGRRSKGGGWRGEA